MKRIVLVMLVLILMSAVSGQARVAEPQYRYGFGMMIGEPTGFTGKYWLNNKESYDVAVSFRFSSYFYLQGGYLYHNYDVFQKTKSPSQVALYYGGGLRFILDSHHHYRKNYEERNYDSILGIKGTIGLNYIMKDLPVELFAELSPIMNVAPATDLDFSAGVGARLLW